MSVSLSARSVSIPVSKRDINLLSSEVWSDDFENVTKTLSEWTIFSDNIPNVTLSNGLLHSDGPGLNVLTHNSTTDTGTWSFDMFLEENNEYWTWLYFMMVSWDDWWGEGYAFNIQSSAGHHFFVLDYIFPGGDGLVELGSVSFDESSTWYHIDITRQSDNWMYVFLNGMLLLEARDSRVISSEYFRINSDNHVVFDNITVSDTVDLDGIAPHWTTPLVNHTINYAEDFSYALSAADYSGLDTWWLDSNLQFKISDEGVVTSRYPMPVGNFEVVVHVNDTFGNVLSGSFNVEVLPLSTDTITSPTTDTGPGPLSPLTIALFGAVGVVWVVAVVFMYRDYRGRKTAC
jgi:hypothetical protein